MSIEIRELVLKAVVVPDEAAAGSAGAGSTGTSNNNVSPKEELINMVVEKILDIIKEKNGR
jgi:Family of unknown function (DUF5908)